MPDTVTDFESSNYWVCASFVSQCPEKLDLKSWALPFDEMESSVAKQLTFNAYSVTVRDSGTKREKEDSARLG